MKRYRKLLIVLGGFVALGVVAVLALVLMVDVDSYRGVIETKAEEALGRDIRLGELSLSILPLGVRVDDIAVARLPEEGEGDLINAASLRVGARLMPLLSKRLEITGVTLEQPSIFLSRAADGTWNVQSLFPQPETAVPEADDSAALEGFAVDSLKIVGGTVTYRDAALNPGQDFETTVSDIDLRIRDLAVDRPIRIDLSATTDAVPDAIFHFDGEVGPLTGSEPLRIAGDARLDDVDPDRLGAVLVQVGVLDSVPESFFGGSTVDLSTEVDLSWSENAGVPVLDFAKFDLDLDGSLLSVRGQLRGEGPVYDADLELLPSRVKAEHITSLLAMAMGEVPVAFASNTPVEIVAQVRGRIGDGSTPDLSGTANLRDFTFEHPGLGQPVEQLDATISIEPDRLGVSELAAVIGSSDVSGELTLLGFETPRVTFALRSQHADFFELFSFITPSDPEGDAGAASDTAAAEELARNVTVDGTLEIAEGSFQKLDFTDLQAAMTWAGGELRLDPCSMTLYDGDFDGTLNYVPFADPPRFDVNGKVASVDIAAILAATMDSGDLLSGKFSGEVGGRGAGADYDSIVRSFDGGGAIEVESGRVGGVDVLGTLSKVTGIFGEQTLSTVSRQLGAEGTEFSNATGDIVVRDGTMQLRNLAIEAPDFALIGDGTVNLLDEQLASSLQIVFSDAVSASMKQEGSRAGAAFWNSDTARVEFPFTLSGPYTAPSAGVDWKGALGTVAKRTAKRELRGLLEEKLGLKQGGEDTSTPPKELQSGTGGTGASTAPPVAASARSSTGPGGLSIEIARARWSGSLLLKDLKLQGTVRGAAIDRVSVEATDASGAVVLRIDRVKAIEKYFAAGADRAGHAEIDWRAKLDGEKAAMAKMPLTVVVRAFNTSGDSVEASRQVSQ